MLAFNLKIREAFMIMCYQQSSLVVNDEQFPLMDRGWLEDEQGGGGYIGISPYGLDNICGGRHARK